MSNDLRAALDDGLGVFQEIVDGLDRGETSDSDLATLDRLDAALPEIRRRLDGDAPASEPIDLDELARACDYSDEDEDGTTDSLIDYKNALEDAIRGAGLAR